MTTSATTKRSFQGWQNVLTFLADMRVEAEEGNANNVEELLKIAAEKYDFQSGLCFLKASAVPPGPGSN